MEKHTPRRPTGRLLFHPDELRLRRLDAYYRVLNEDPDGTGFPAALRDLSEHVGHFPTSGRDPSEGAKQSIVNFVERWRLPRQHGAGDVWRSLRQPTDRVPLRLRPGIRSYFRPSIGTIVEINACASPDDEPFLVAELRPTIVPWVPLAFDYDPRSCDSALLRAHAEELASMLRDDIIAQAEAIEADAHEKGYRPIPPRHVNPQELNRSARRLYRRTARELTWSAIANLETGESPESVDSQAVAATVNEWAKWLDIPLPQRRGRPRGPKSS